MIFINIFAPLQFGGMNTYLNIRGLILILGILLVTG